MALISKPFTYSAGGTIIASDHNSNYDTIYNEFNGSISNANIDASAAIVDTKLAQLTTASKVSYSALVSGTNALDENKGADIASATTTDIGAATGNFVDITGTTTITGLGTVQAGTRRITQFDDALILTHSGSALILPGNANITTAAGDIAHWISLGSGNWICTNYQVDANAAGGGGKIIQVVNVTDSAVATGTTVMPFDDTIPQNTEGIEVMTLAITPTNTNSKLLIEARAHAATSSGTTGRISIALFQDSTAGSLKAGAMVTGQANQLDQVELEHFMTAGTTSATTFKIRIGDPAAGTVTFNGQSAARIFGGIMDSHITITEISA